MATSRWTTRSSSAELSPPDRSRWGRDGSRRPRPFFPGIDRGPTGFKTFLEFPRHDPRHFLRSYWTTPLGLAILPPRRSFSSPPLAARARTKSQGWTLTVRRVRNGELFRLIDPLGLSVSPTPDSV